MFYFPTISNSQKRFRYSGVEKIRMCARNYLLLQVILDVSGPWYRIVGIVGGALNSAWTFFLHYTLHLLFISTESNNIYLTMNFSLIFIHFMLVFHVSDPSLLSTFTRFMESPLCLLLIRTDHKVNSDTDLLLLSVHKIYILCIQF